MKWGFAQIYRSLNISDEQMKDIIQMKGYNAYFTYSTEYNDSAPDDLP